MSENPGARMHGLQPPLPLVDPGEAPVVSTPSGTGAEWRLDEHTREVGRRGIAAAREALRSSARGTRDARPRPSAAGPNRAPGRAA